MAVYTPPMAVTWSIPSVGITANTNVPDANGCVWTVTAEKGWSGSPPPRTGRIGKPSAQGMYRIPMYYDARVVSLTGYVEGPTTAARRASEHLLASAFSSPGVLSELHCIEESGELLGTFELDAATQITQVSRTMANFTLQVASPDPRKYTASVSTATTNLPSSVGGLDWSTGGGLNWSTGGGLNWGTTTSNGTITIVNAGTADTWPTFTIAANGNVLSTPGITVTINGNLLLYNSTLQANDSLVITTNPTNRSVILNGVADRRPFLTTAQWQSIAANTSAVIAFSSATYTSTATLTAMWQSAYW